MLYVMLEVRVFLRATPVTTAAELLLLLLLLLLWLLLLLLLWLLLLLLLLPLPLSTPRCYRATVSCDGAEQPYAAKKVRVSASSVRACCPCVRVVRVMSSRVPEFLK